MTHAAYSRSAIAIILAVLAVIALLLVWLTLPRPGAGGERLCDSYGGLPGDWLKDSHAGMVAIPGVRGFQPGNPAGYPEEALREAVDLQTFWIDRTEVTNAQFASFVTATGYVTEAEQAGEAVVFVGLAPGARPGESWWRLVTGANWRHPEGPDSDIEQRMNHPVVHVTYADALAYAHWLGRDLPTEAEWEYAARAGGPGKGLEQQPQDADGQFLANFWQGQFPFANEAEDGHALRAPVGCFRANEHGLYDMVGNVWEWTHDHFAGPANASAATAETPATRVIKGGSFLCAENFCRRYRSTSRHPQEEDLPIAHLGFRTVMR